jgi:hypothetical protein
MIDLMKFSRNLRIEIFKKDLSYGVYSYYIGNYIHFEMLLIESGKGHLAQNKSENFVGSFASWVALFPGSSYFHPELIIPIRYFTDLFLGFLLASSSAIF